ncbi:MAG: hypothetical protein BM485_11220 [Desulfobulbaceae bacterium DB1]|nr:MAG: hypothetical protein BM485_11220 [Desulfobulbaceae bacterium DB1]
MSQFTSNMLAIYKFLAVAVLKFFRAPQFLGRIRDTSRIQEVVKILFFAILFLVHSLGSHVQRF